MAPFCFTIPLLMLGFVSLYYLVSINALTLFAFRVDKKRAIAGDWRISENALLMMSLCGGWPAAKIAQRRYRHKTCKQPFVFLLNVVPLVWAGAIVVLLAQASFPHIELDAMNAFAPETQTPQQRTTPKFFSTAGD